LIVGVPAVPQGDHSTGRIDQEVRGQAEHRLAVPRAG
jgi:hypothetical protein